MSGFHVAIGFDFEGDPRVEAIGTDAIALHVLALCHAGKYGTDGHLTRATVRRLYDLDWQAAAGHLVEQGMWAPTSEGWRIIGYLEDEARTTDSHWAQMSKADTDALRAKWSGDKRRARLHRQGVHDLCVARNCHVKRNSTGDS